MEPEQPPLFEEKVRGSVVGSRRVDKRGGNFRDGRTRDRRESRLSLFAGRRSIRREARSSGTLPLFYVISAPILARCVPPACSLLSLSLSLLLARLRAFFANKAIKNALSFSPFEFFLEFRERKEGRPPSFHLAVSPSPLLSKFTRKIIIHFFHINVSAYKYIHRLVRSYFCL